LYTGIWSLVYHLFWTYGRHGLFCGYEETRIYELFDIYTWLYSSDENRISHLYNLFCLLTENDFEFEFDTYIDGHPLWHLEWINRDFFIYRLFEDLQSDEGKLLFNNARYILQIPKYNIEHRANTAFIRICCALLRYLTLPYYDEDYDLVFNCLSKAFLNIQKKLITEISNNMEISEEQFELLDDIIDITEPIFSKCCSISKEGDYNIYIEDAPANVVNPADNIDDFPLTVGLCAYYAKNTYVLYQFVHFFLRLWITYFKKIGYAEDQIDKLEKRLDWEREICVELYRIDKGFNHFFDFYYETPEYYCGISNIAKDFNGLNEVYVDSGFDENTEEYFSEIFETLETSPHPFYLYKLLLTPDFPVSDCLYDRLIDADFGQYILEKGRLTEDEKTEILEFALEKYSAEFMKSDDKNTFYTYRQEQSERIYRYNNGVFEQVQVISDDDIIVRNHIVVLLDQVIKSLTPDCL